MAALLKLGRTERLKGCRKKRASSGMEERIRAYLG